MVKLTQEFVKAALTLADAGRSKVGDRERERFGLSSPRLKALLNNLNSNSLNTFLFFKFYTNIKNNLIFIRFIIIMIST